MDEQKELDNSDRQTGLPVLYTNAILVTLTVADISLTLTVNGQPTHLLNMSLTTAKTLVSHLSNALEDYQNKTSTKILEIKDVAALMSKKS